LFSIIFLAQEGWNGNGAQNADNHNHNQQFHQREAGLLKLVALLAALQALEECALGQQLGLEAGGHGRVSSVEYLNSIALPARDANKDPLSRI
jgi:hypothetical protein